MMWDTIAEENSGDMAMEYTNCQMQHDLNTVADTASNDNAAATTSNRRRQHQHHSLMMNNSSLLHDMAVDHHPLSFYDDDEGDLAQLQLHQQQQRLCPTVFGSPTQQMRLLSPEGSPCRLQILEKPKTPKYQQDFYNNTNNQRYQQQTLATRLQKLQHIDNGSTSTSSPTKSLRIYHSLSSGSMGSSSMEDDYMDLLEMEVSSTRSPASNAALTKIPSDLDSLFMGQIKSLLSPAHQQHAIEQHKSPLLDQLEQLRTPEMRRPPVRRCLSMTDNYLPTPKTPETLLKQVQELATSPFGTKMLTTERNMSAINYCFKRPEPPSKTNSPVQIKRHRVEAEKENLDVSMSMSLAALPTIPTTIKTSHHHPPPLRKSMSMNDAQIMSALARSDSTDEPDLIGDFSKPFALPLMEGRHRDLKSISCDTMARLVRGEFNDVVSNYRIIDCRYPYEYEGGHILGAENFYTHEQIIAEFLTRQKTEEAQLRAVDKRRNIIIFHCEFSSERGPKLSRFLRSTDREHNTNCYPTLDYPEIYLLHNGYKEFYEQHSELCVPIAYRPMLEPAYNSEYRHFRSKSKSWNGDGGSLGGATGRLKKSRSRLML
ncbi:M-phase inducer phosphatase [Eurosta solidaginis]|uniref:M-phase inducer phosphatase n=1 Tax=Eurosta solidaginis TaxID=178769 RepID=UPI0035317206